MTTANVGPGPLHAVQGDPRPLLILASKRTRLAEAREDIRGRHVFDSHAHEVGLVDGLLIDAQSHHVRLIQVRTRTGFLGLHRHTATIPVDLIARVEPEAIYLDQTKQAVESGPKLGDHPDLDDKLIASVYAFYRLAPFWDPAYVAPLFHSHSHTAKHLHHH